MGTSHSGAHFTSAAVSSTLKAYSDNAAQKEADADKAFVADCTEIAVREPNLSEEQKRSVDEMEEVCQVAEVLRSRRRTGAHIF